MQELLTNKINDFAQYLTNNCNSEEKKELIKTKMIDLKLTDILLFITFLNANKIDSEILLFINTFELNDSDNVKEKIKEYITYFLNVKNIINK